jgi:Carboxypeptidase regulatory-like domain
LSLLIFSVILEAAALGQGLGTLSGSVVDPQGAAVSNSTVELRWNYVDNRMSWNGARPKVQKQRHNKTRQVSTDMAGRFSVALPEGNWDVFAYRDGFAPTCTIVLIESGKATKVELRFPKLAAMSVQ